MKPLAFSFSPVLGDQNGGMNSVGGNILRLEYRKTKIQTWKVRHVASEKTQHIYIWMTNLY